MTTEQAKQLIIKGEGIEVEFKESYNSLDMRTKNWAPAFVECTSIIPCTG